MPHSDCIKIGPSILAADFARLGEEVRAAVDGGADYIHVDVMDGDFVPPITFGAQMIAAIKPYAGGLPLVIHMMVTEPVRQVEDIIKAGGDVIVVHAEACTDLNATIEAIRKAGAKAGIAVKPDTPESVIEAHLEDIAVALLMTVEPGYGGQPYIPDVEAKIARFGNTIDARGLSGDVEIEVDGGINEGTVEAAVKAGARMIVAGTAVYGREESIEERITLLRGLAESAAAE